MTASKPNATADLIMLPTFVFFAMFDIIKYDFYMGVRERQEREVGSTINLNIK